MGRERRPRLITITIKTKIITITKTIIITMVITSSASKLSSAIRRSALSFASSASSFS